MAYDYDSHKVVYGPLSMALIAKKLDSVMKKSLNKFMAVDSELYQRAKLLIDGLNVTRLTFHPYSKTK